MNSRSYLCPDCDKSFLEFKKITSEGIIFFCGYCRRDVVVKDAKPEYLPNQAVTLRRNFPATEREF